MKKSVLISTVVSLLLIIAMGVFLKSGQTPQESTVSNVTEVDGKQIIEITAKGGYSPRLTTAKANMPTVLKMQTNGTYDCSASLAIPSLGVQSTLKPSGEMEIEIPPQESGKTLQGLCGMGMYNFGIKFE